MRIIFMGTPDYAVKTLQAVVDAGHEVVAVFSQPDKPVGRKQILTPPPVKVLANTLGIPVFQPVTLKDTEIQQKIMEMSPEAIVVVAYGKLLPPEVLSIPKYGCVNGHASLLPKYRGASPIQWSIYCGDSVTGVTTMFMNEGMDTGDILETTEVRIGPKETAEELFERLSGISAELMVSTLNKLPKGELCPEKQDNGKATYAPIIKKEMAFLDFTKTAEEHYNAVRAFYSWPCAYFFLNSKRIKVIEAAVGPKTDKQSGTVIANENSLAIACKDGTSLEIITLQPEGSKPMGAKQFLCGNQIPLGTKVNQDV